MPEYPEAHKNHMCYMIQREGLMAKIDIERVKGLVSPANYVCADCGRAAAKAENLCNPIEL